MVGIIEKFELSGTPVKTEPYGNGHINNTFLVETDKGAKYILQKLNTYVFKDIPGLMNNMILIGKHISERDPDPRHSVKIMCTVDGKPFYRTEDGECWRVLQYIENSFSPENAETPEDLAKAGNAFGLFQERLADFPARKLSETIPDFHNTPKRLEKLLESAGKDPLGRAAAVKKQIEFAVARKDDCHYMTDLADKGLLPVRVTHNDTKLNNVLFDKDTREPLCVVDLDTVMPGLIANDFGDTIRFGASTAAEDEKDLSRVSLSLEHYRAYTCAFLKACGNRLTDTEIRTLPWGAKLMTLENGIRFLTDYLDGDVYFRIAYPEHNLDRAKAQFRLVEDMEAKWDRMNEIIEEARKVIYQPKE